jgi:hypothetical protein
VGSPKPQLITLVTSFGTPQVLAHAIPITLALYCAKTRYPPDDLVFRCIHVIMT